MSFLNSNCVILSGWWKHPNNPFNLPEKPPRTLVYLKHIYIEWMLSYINIEIQSFNSYLRMTFCTLLLTVFFIVSFSACYINRKILITQMQSF